MSHGPRCMEAPCATCQIETVLDAHRAMVSGDDDGWHVICSCGHNEVGFGVNAHLAQVLLPMVSRGIDDCTCPRTSVDEPTPSDPNCPAYLREERLRRQMAATWDDGLLAHTHGLGSGDNPYRRAEYCGRGPCSSLLGHEGDCTL